MDFLIRDAELADASSFARLFGFVEEFHRERLPARFRRPNGGYAEDFLKETLARDDSRIFVAESGGAVVGYVFLMIKEMPSHPLIHPGKLVSVEQLSVDPKARRMGVGSKLMSGAEKFAKENGFLELELNVWKFNPDAEEFYGRLGYAATRTSFSKKL
ncbi:MAG: GNAT family N-acetyltransferase [Elusimicrobiota bacterium]